MRRPPEPPASPPRRAVWLTMSFLMGAVALVVFSGLGGPHDTLTGVVVVLERLVFAGGPAAFYLLGAFGLGRVLTRALMPASSSPFRPALQFGLGLAMLLFVSHGCAAAGWFAGARGSWLALAIVAVGALVGADQLVRAALRKRPPLAVSWLGPLNAISGAVLLVAAANPPGWLWGSEFGGYDALSYHLQLPQEWLAAGRLRPVPHNVYSFLPSYFEGAFLHLAAMTFAPAATPDTPGGLLTGEGHRVISCEFLHAFVTMIAAWTTGHAAAALGTPAPRVRSVAETALRIPTHREASVEQLPMGTPPPRAVNAGSEPIPTPGTGVPGPNAIATALVLATPWCVVTGSLAYNDMAVCALFAAGILACLAPLTPVRRGVAVGLLAAAACSVKPTALFFVAIPLGLVLLAQFPLHAWPRAVIPGAIIGLLVMAPWLWRNYEAAGNPVFPFSDNRFPNAVGGTGHWSAEQVTRYLSAHDFDGGLWAMLTTLVSTDRGIFHPQWFAFFPALLASIAVTLWLRWRRRPDAVRWPLLLAVLLIQLMCWLLATHLQSRFLLPLIVPGAILIAHALTSLRVGLILACVLTLAQLGALMNAFDQPNTLLTTGIARHTGTALREALRRGEDDWLEHAWPDEYINAVLPPGTVYCLGGATPLYLRPGTIYNTTWDHWPFAAAPAATVAQALRAQGVRYVLVDLGEIRRLNRSGWADPTVKEGGVAEWMTAHTRLVRGWPEAGVFLVELPGAAP